MSHPLGAATSGSDRPNAEVPRCLLLRRCQEYSGHKTRVPQRGRSDARVREKEAKGSASTTFVPMIIGSASWLISATLSGGRRANQFNSRWTAQLARRKRTEKPLRVKSIFARTFKLI
jgi:hypothetical protein